MRNRIMAFSAIAILSVALGVGWVEYAATSSHPVPYPDQPPTLGGTTAIAAKNGVLKCKGKIVKIKKADLRPELAPHPDLAVDSPRIEEFGCAKDKAGKETGDVAAKAKRKDGTTTIVTIAATE